MSSLEENIGFARRRWQALGGERWTIASGDDGEEPSWLYSEYWLPLHSFRLWPVNKDHICTSCRRLTGGLTQDYFSTEPTRTLSHRDEHECAGLTSEPIQFLFLDLPRRTGKTVGTSGFVGALLFKGWRESVLFMAGSEKQVQKLFDEHYRAPIEASAALSKLASVLGTSVTVPKTGGQLDIVPTSMSGATGGGKTLLVIDECRIVPPKVFAAIVPQVLDQNGWHCPTGGRGHLRTHGNLDDPDHPTECPCGDRLIPWVGKCLAMTSAGEIIEGKNWFHETVESLQAKPHPRSWVYSERNKVVGKMVAKSTVNAVTEIFGDVPSLGTYINIETENMPRRPGEDWLKKAEIDAVMSSALTQSMASERPCVAFLDTSRTGHLTSFVVVADDSDQDTEEAWSRLVVERIDIWEPAKQANGVIDDRAIEAHLDEWIPCFPLVALRVDTRVMPWAVQLVKRCRRGKPYRGIIGGVSWRDAERNASWNALERHILAKTIRLPANKRLRAELRGARRFENSDGVISVREHRGKTKHLDVAESLAACAYLAHLQTLKRRTRLADVESAVSVTNALRRRGPKRGRWGPNSY